MKRVLYLLLLICFAFSLTSCDSTHSHIHSESEMGDEELDLIAGVDEDRENIEDYGLTIAVYNENVDSLVIQAFEETYGVKVRVISFEEEDLTGLDTKLMAEDDDVDLFRSSTLDLYRYIQKGYFVDLNQFEGLKERLDSCSYTRFASDYSGEYFGLPLFPNVTKENYCLREYYLNNLNLVEGVYNDPDGEELFKILRKAYDMQDFWGCDYYNEEYTSILDEYLMISPYSQNKELAAKFLEISFDYYSGKTSLTDTKGNVVTFFNPYPDIEGVEGLYKTWTYSSKEFISILSDISEDTFSSDGSDEALREIAQEAARQVKMRLEG